MWAAGELIFHMASYGTTMGVIRFSVRRKRKVVHRNLSLLLAYMIPHEGGEGTYVCDAIAQLAKN